ncbi:MAG: hypothetical protein EBR79_01575, partial [Proteobacteria bacterium]|nr:hypothetical protein [Pseudomonadota bacterium]
MFRLLLALTLLSGAAAAQDALTPDGFPSDYKPEDFIPAVPTPKAGPATFSINQLKRQPLTPSGTLPIALPPATTTSTSPSTAPTREILRPLSAVFPVRTTSTVAASDDSLSERSELSESPTRRS